MGIGSINWSKMLNKELEEEFKKKDEILEEIKNRKKMELAQNIKLTKKNKQSELTEKGNVLS
jgi:predicted phosphoribosyltransferase